jgi:transcriptional regulator with XRE-family HTH domain
MDTDIFIKRFKEILEDNNYTASALADELEIQRSSISHLLSGRNKPSLDFILKLLKKFPEINMYWLLNGVDPKYKSDKAPFKDNSIEHTPTKVNQDKNIIPIEAISNKNKKIKHIVIFYEDATFESYTPN